MADPKKPGWKTSELYLGLVAALLSTLFASGVMPTTGPIATIAMIAALTLTSLGYTVSRTTVKKANAGGTGTIKEMAVGQLLTPGAPFETTTNPGDVAQPR